MWQIGFRNVSLFSGSRCQCYTHTKHEATWRAPLAQAKENEMFSEIESLFGYGWSVLFLQFNNDKCGKTNPECLSVLSQSLLMLQRYKAGKSDRSVQRTGTHTAPKVRNQNVLRSRVYVWLWVRRVLSWIQWTQYQWQISQIGSQNLALFSASRFHCYKHKKH